MEQHSFEIQIVDPTCVAMLLTQLVKMTETMEGMTELLEAGWEPSFVDQLRHLPSRDITEITRRTKSFFAKVSPHDLKNTIWLINNGREAQKKLEYFVRNGASREMVSRLWSMSLQQVSTIRNQLKSHLKNTPEHEVSDQKQEAIYRAWSEILDENPNSPERDKIYLLHNRFSDLSIETAYNIATKYDSISAPKKSKRIVTGNIGESRVQ